MMKSEMFLCFLTLENFPKAVQEVIQNNGEIHFPNEIRLYVQKVLPLIFINTCCIEWKLFKFRAIVIN